MREIRQHGSEGGEGNLPDLYGGPGEFVENDPGRRRFVSKRQIDATRRGPRTPLSGGTRDRGVSGGTTVVDLEMDAEQLEQAGGKRRLPAPRLADKDEWAQSDMLAAVQLTKDVVNNSDSMRELEGQRSAHRRQVGHGRQRQGASDAALVCGLDPPSFSGFCATYSRHHHDRGIPLRVGLLKDFAEVAVHIQGAGLHRRRASIAADRVVRR